ncbi:hypothetical protein [Sphingobacterium olei]|nr:hypothetical protein [Sphingobacterium olei]
MAILQALFSNNFSNDKPCGVMEYSTVSEKVLAFVAWGRRK